MARLAAGSDFSYRPAALVLVPLRLKTGQLKRIMA